MTAGITASQLIRTRVLLILLCSLSDCSGYDNVRPSTSACKMVINAILLQICNKLGRQNAMQRHSIPTGPGRVVPGRVAGHQP